MTVDADARRACSNMKGYDDLPPAVRRRLQIMPANFPASEAAEICHRYGEQEALRRMARWIVNNRPDFTPGRPEKPITGKPRRRRL